MRLTVYVRANDLFISDWDLTIDERFLTDTLTPNNVALTNGALNMKVSAYAGSGNVFAAEIGTTYNFKYGSVRTYLKSSSVPGVCEGNFLYGTSHRTDCVSSWSMLNSSHPSQQEQRSGLGGVDKHHRHQQ